MVKLLVLLMQTNVEASCIIWFQAAREPSKIMMLYIQRRDSA
jgi:hypothetical protein